MPDLLQGDPFGSAVLDYYKHKWRAAKIKVESNISGSEKISPAYLFRNFTSMPDIEQYALENCSGKVLDVGACAGSHSLYLQNKGIEVHALEISEKCCEVMKARGVQNVICKDYFKYETPAPYNTLLFMMNGIGIAGTLNGLEKLLAKSKNLLAPNGKILFDSSDIDYAYYEDDGSKWINLNSEYQGEVKYSLSYKKKESSTFDWLFIDPKKMDEVASKLGFVFKLLKEGNHYDYLGELRMAK